MIKLDTLTTGLRNGLGAIALSAVCASGALAQDTVTLRFASFVGPNSFLNTDIFRVWFDQLEAESNGKLTIEIMAGGSIAKPTEVFDTVMAGVVDMGWGITAYNPGRFIAAGVPELPLLATGSTESSAAIAALYDQGLIDGMDDVQVIGIATADIARLQSADAITGLADLHGKKIRAAGSVLSSMIEEIGATPVGIPAPSIAEALAKNVVDAAATDWFAVESFSLMDVTTAHIDISLGTTSVYLVMNKAKYESLPDDIKAVFEANPPSDFAAFWGPTLEAESNRVRGVIADNPDHTIITPTDAEMEIWNAAGATVTQAWVDNTPNGAAILAAYKEALTAFRASN